jgi:hypothetical protein
VHFVSVQYIQPSVHYEKAVPRKTNKKYGEGKTDDWQLFFAEGGRVGAYASHPKGESSGGPCWTMGPLAILTLSNASLKWASLSPLQAVGKGRFSLKECLVTSSLQRYLQAHRTDKASPMLHTLRAQRHIPHIELEIFTMSPTRLVLVSNGKYTRS